jgi:hypothetical protein
MTKKRIGTKRRRVKKQTRRKSRKMKKSMRGGSPLFVQKIIRCIPQDLPDIPISSSGYMNNDDDWTKLAENISHNGPIEFQCDGKDAEIYGDNSIRVDFDNNIKIGKLYGRIGNSQPVLLWWNGRQQTYEPPSSNILPPPPLIESRPVTPPRITRENGPPPLNRRNTNQGVYPPDIPTIHDENNDIGVSLFENEIPYYRGVIGYNNLRKPTRYPLPKPPRTQ